MANADLKRLMNDARVHLPSALDPAIQQELFATVDEFLKTSNVWQETIAVNVTPASTTYALNTQTDGVINRLMWVFDANGVAISAAMQVPGTLTLQYAPSQSQIYSATVALTVTDPTSSENYPLFEEWILTKYRQVLFEGVLGKMMGQPSKPYSNPQLAIYHTRRFMNFMGAAKAEAAHQNTFRGQNWAFPRGFASSRRKGAF